MNRRLAALLATATLGHLALGQGTILTSPTVHGNTIIFTAEGDLWSSTLDGSNARRLTSDSGSESFAQISPDGKLVAFTGQYDGGTDVYVMPVQGGVPKRLTFDPKSSRTLCWTADSKSIVFRSSREAPFAEIKLYSVPATGGLSTKLPVPRGEFASMGANGLLAYVPVSWEWANWYRYQGGSADDIWLCDTRAGTFKRLTDDPGVDTSPVWCGNAIYFVSERSGSSNLWRLDPNSKKVQQVTRYTSGPVRYPSSDGRSIVFEHGPGLALFDTSTGTVKELKVQLNSDQIHTRDQFVRLSSWVSNPAIGPTGKRVAIEARGQIVSVPVKDGDMRIVENMPGTRAMLPAWSADGKKLAFVSDRSGENELWVTDAQGGSSPTQLTTGLAANPPTPPRWSPDGKWIAIADREARMMLIDASTGKIKVVDQGGFTGSYDTGQNYAFSPDSRLLTFDRWEQNWYRTVSLFEIETGKLAKVTDGVVDSYAPSFDSKGEFLLYLADSNLDPVVLTMTSKFGFDKASQAFMVPLSLDTASPFLAKNDEEGAAPEKKEDKKEEKPAKPEPVAIDWDGLIDRTIEVPLPAGRYSHIEGIDGKLLLSGAADEPFQVSGNGGIELNSFDIAKKSFAKVLSGIGGFALSADRKKILVQTGNSISVLDASTGPTSVDSGAVNLAPYTLSINPKREWQQVFNESWRIARDFFYDPGMHGVDWKAMRTKYQAMMSQVGSRGDLTRLLKDMVSELNCGHAYVGAANPAPRSLPAAYLGVDYEAVPGARAVKIKRLLRGDTFNKGLRSPLLEPGLKVKEGDYILAVNGNFVNENEDIQALLIGLRGQTIALTVNDKPQLEGSRVVRVKPMNSENDLRYQDWVDGRADYVKKHGGENFGYAHIPDMGSSGLIGFSKGHFPNVMKDAMIYDTRFNGGGWVSSLLLENINLRPVQWWKPRYGGYWSRESWANIGYKAAICNEDNFSDGELFIETWKRLKLGPVVGKTTGGGEVGSGGGYTLIDGGWLYIPNYAGFAGDEWLVEGRGAHPDVEVDQDPAAVMAGRDPQLDKAIALLKEMLAKNPIKRPQHPPFPKKLGGSNLEGG